MRACSGIFGAARRDLFDRARFAIEVAKATATAIGADRVGFRMSPHGNFNGMGSFDGDDAQFIALATALGRLGLVYLHLVNHESMGNPPVPARLPSELNGTFYTPGEPGYTEYPALAVT